MNAIPSVRKTALAVGTKSSPAIKLNPAPGLIRKYDCLHLQTVSGVLQSRSFSTLLNTRSPLRRASKGDGVGDVALFYFLLYFLAIYFFEP